MDGPDVPPPLGEALKEGLTPASAGTGPLLQRDYWGVIEGCRLRAPEVAALVLERFPEFAPAELVVFERRGGKDGPLEVGDELGVAIRMAGETAVRVIHADANSLTLATMAGHPESGRITFGAYPNDRGDVVFHIRSRACSGSSTHYVGFLALGEAMQTNTWTDFIDAVAHTVGDGVVGAIRAETQEVERDEADDALDGPTFIAEGG